MTLVSVGTSGYAGTNRSGTHVLDHLVLLINRDTRVEVVVISQDSI